MRTVIYTRSATIDEARLESQKAACREFAEAQGWSVVAYYADAGTSGCSLKRSQLERMLQDAQDGRFDVIVIHRVDRLARSLSALWQIVQALRASRVEVASICEGWKASLFAGHLLSLMTLAMMSDAIQREEADAVRGT